MERKDSYPAVSQTCIFTLVPSTSDNVFEPKSTPIVKSWESLNLLSKNYRSRHDFPTLVSPTIIYLKMYLYPSTWPGVIELCLFN